MNASRNDTTQSGIVFGRSRERAWDVVERSRACGALNAVMTVDDFVEAARTRPPKIAMLEPGHVGVRELTTTETGGYAQRRRDVHLLQRHARDTRSSSRDDLESPICASVSARLGFDEAMTTSTVPATKIRCRLVEHAVCIARARGDPIVHLEALPRSRWRGGEREGSPNDGMRS